MPGSCFREGKWTSYPCAFTGFWSKKSTCPFRALKGPQENRQPLCSQAGVCKDHDLQIAWDWMGLDGIGWDEWILKGVKYDLYVIRVWPVKFSELNFGDRFRRTQFVRRFLMLIVTHLNRISPTKNRCTARKTMSHFSTKCGIEENQRTA